MFAEEKSIQLKIEHLTKSYALKSGFFDRQKGTIKAVDDVSFTVRNGEIFGLVGESGCGKTTTGRLILRVLEPNGGDIMWYNNPGEPVNLCRLSNKKMRPFRQKMQMIFQDPYSSLDPRMTVMQIVGEPLRAGRKIPMREYKARIADALNFVRLHPEMMNRYPHAFSGGQRQRIGIARALITKPDLVVADEPVSALDVSVQAQILNLLQELQSALNLTMIFIAHDLSVIRHICDTVAVMYLGRLVEVADRTLFFQTPRHPYSEMLFDAVPGLKNRKANEHMSKNFMNDETLCPSGCLFFSRCRYKQALCREQAPTLKAVSPGHNVACHFDLELKGI